MPNLVKAEPKSSNLVLCEVFWFRLFFGNTFVSLTIFWFNFLFWFLRWFARKCLELVAIFKISDYFFLLFYKFVSFFGSEKNVFWSQVKKPIDNPVQSIGNPFCAFLHRNGLLIYCDLHRFTYSFTHSTFHNECANSLSTKRPN